MNHIKNETHIKNENDASNPMTSPLNNPNLN
jgi:hypothetical protein